MTDWDKAYDNSGSIEGAEEYLNDWAREAEAFRLSMTLRKSLETDLPYGKGERNRFDIFKPVYEAKGTVIFIHGGYWRRLDKSWFSHLAAGPLSHGWNVAMPSYTLAPAARISDISKEVAKAITIIAGENEGPIRLIGHSAGGHLVSRMHCGDDLLPQEVYSRLANTVAVSGLFDLDPLEKTKMNEDLQLNAEEVQTESPVHHLPRKGARITCLVGGSELPEFLRQNELLASWKAQGANVKTIADQGKHHFSVIDGLANPSSLLNTVLLA